MTITRALKNVSDLTTAERAFDAHVAATAKRKTKKGIVRPTSEDKHEMQFQERLTALAEAVANIIFTGARKNDPVKIGRAQLKAMMDVPYLRDEHIEGFDLACLEQGVAMTNLDGYFVFTPMRTMVATHEVSSLICLGIKADLDRKFNVQPKAKRDE